MYSFPFATPFPLFRIPSFISGLPASGALTSVKPPCRTGQRIRTPKSSGSTVDRPEDLLDFDLRAGFFQLLLDFVRFVLADAGLDRFRSLELP